MTVLDASALLVCLRDEQGADAVQEALAEMASIGTVNLSEVLSKLVDGGQDPGKAMERIGVLPLEVVPFDEDLAVETARLRPLTVQAGLSLGGRACLALARRRGVRALTADAAWQRVTLDVDIVLVR